MRAFVILSFIAVASAGRLGYNYQQGISGANDFALSGSGFNPGFALGGGQSVSRGSGISIISGNSGLGGAYGGQVQGSGISYGINGGGSIGSGLGGGISFGNGQSTIGSGINYGSSGLVGGGLVGGVNFDGAGSNQVIDGGLSKEYYTFSAPEEQVQPGQNTQSVSTLLKKNLRIIFIKAPENNGIHNAALQIARQATEDKTAIYVLSKEPDVSEIANQVQEISENVRAKPEVRFVKYRTAEDALNAQITIQQQYESLGGSSQSSNEGVAPVLNFASPAAAVHEHIGHVHGQNLGQVGSGSANLLSSGSSALNFGSALEQSSENEYLPPAVKK